MMVYEDDRLLPSGVDKNGRLTLNSSTYRYPYDRAMVGFGECHSELRTRILNQYCDARDAGWDAYFKGDAEAREEAAERQAKLGADLDAIDRACELMGELVKEFYEEPVDPPGPLMAARLKEWAKKEAEHRAKVMAEYAEVVARWAK